MMDNVIDILQNGEGAVIIHDVVSGDKLDSMQKEFKLTIIDSSPKEDKTGRELNPTWDNIVTGPPGSNGCSIAKDCGFPQSKIAWSVRLETLPLYRKLYRIEEKNAMASSMDCLFFSKKVKTASSLPAHYDYSEDPNSPAQLLHKILSSKVFDHFVSEMKNTWCSLKLSQKSLYQLFNIVTANKDVDQFLLKYLISNYSDLLQEIRASGIEIILNGEWTKLGHRFLEDAVRVVHSKARITDAIQGILTLHSTDKVGTVFAKGTLEDDKTKRIKRCGPQSLDEKEKDRRSCFRPLSQDDLESRVWTAPQGRTGSLVLWNSKKAHKNSLPIGGERWGAAVAWLPQYASKENTKKRKREQVLNGGGTNHWASACMKNGSVNAYYNSPKHPHKYWCVPMKKRVDIKDVEMYL